MGKRGLKPKPTEVKKRNGNPGRRALNAAEPSAGSSVKKPSRLQGAGSDLWDELIPLLSKMKLLDRADSLTLEMLCDAWSNYVEADDFIRAKGSVYKAPTGKDGFIVRQFPQVAQRSDAWKRLRSLISEFGFTPSARVSLGTKDSTGGALDALLTKYSGN